jgi:hypothetical protein
MRLSFTDDENWGAPFYELYVELGPHPSSLARFVPAWEVLWSHPTLDGPYADGSRPLAAQQRVDVRNYVSEEAGHMLGMATLPDGHEAPCGCVVHIPNLAQILALPQEIHGGLNITYGPDPLEPGEDAFTFYLPFPALDKLYGVNWENDSLPEGVGQALDEWLASVATAIYNQVPFSFAAAGPEGSYNPERVREGTIPTGSGALILRPDPPGGELRRYVPTY